MTGDAAYAAAFHDVADGARRARPTRHLRDVAVGRHAARRNRADNGEDASSEAGGGCFGHQLNISGSISNSAGPGGATIDAAPCGSPLVSPRMRASARHD